MIIQADYELMELKLEEVREEIAALKKENEELRAQVDHLAGSNIMKENYRLGNDICGLIEENDDLKADNKQLQEMSNAQADFTNHAVREITALRREANRVEPLLLENHDLGYQINVLEEDNTALRSRLSAYEEGIRPEDADKSTSYVYYFDGNPVLADWSNVEGCWIFIWNKSIHHIELSARLYPLPQEKEDR